MSESVSVLALRFGLRSAFESQSGLRFVSVLPWMLMFEWASLSVWRIYFR
jgi:hypothetical protein